MTDAEQPSQWAEELLGDLVGLWAAFGEDSAVRHLQRVIAERDAELVGALRRVEADEDTLSRLFWTPLPDCKALDVAIRDYIRGGPDPFLKDRP